MSKSYAGIGSRSTPPEVQEQMRKIAFSLGNLGYTLRSGGAQGADSAFEEGCCNFSKEIYLPWKEFRGNASPLYKSLPEHFQMAEKFHPTWNKLSQTARKMMARNCCQVLGYHLDDPVDFVICWTPGGLGSGGTGQALRIAKHYNIKITDLGTPRQVHQCLGGGLD